MAASAIPFVAFAAVLGTLCADRLPLDERVFTALGILCLGIHMVAARKPGLFRAAVVATLVAAYANAAVHERLLPQTVATHTARFSGVVSSQRATTQDGRNEYIVDLDDGLRVLVTVTRAHIGDRVLVRGRLEPFDEARNPGEPSERDMERARGIDARIASAAILEAIPSRTWSARVELARLHAWALDQLQTYLGEPNAGIVAGELWGERADMPPDVRAEFQETGTVHILVTAGLHVGLVAMLLVTLGSALTLPRALTCALATIGVWCFALWSGADVPAVRAATMASAVLAARGFGAATTSWNSLSLAAIVIAFLLPFSVASPSFALSFACVGAIFACTPLLERCLAPIALPHRLNETLLLTIATQLGTWPLTAAVFLQFAPYAILANAAIVPCVPATMVLGALQLAAAPIPALAQAFANLNAWILAWMLAIVRLVSSLPLAVIPMTPAPAVLILAYEATLLILTPLMRRNATSIGVALILTAGSLVLWPSTIPNHQLQITVLDVGQADSIVIQTPSGHALLVDGGGRLERGMVGADSSAEIVGERIVVPFLLRQGIHSLDEIILSHPHGDHVGGCAPVLRKIRVAEIADSGQTYGGHAYHDCLDTAHADGVAIVQPRAGMVWQTNDGVTLTFIGPSLPFIEGKNAINDNSIAFIVQYHKFRMFFTGDAGVAAEQRFLGEGIDLHADVPRYTGNWKYRAHHRFSVTNSNDYIPPVGQVDVLKVGHHGSAYSSSPEFIRAVRPRYAIISVGRHNLFGHPARSTIQTLKGAGAAVYRTDENGAVTIETNGNGEIVVKCMIACNV